MQGFFTDFGSRFFTTETVTVFTDFADDKQGRHYGTIRCVRTLRPSFAKKHAFFVMVLVRYFGSLFEFASKAFYVQCAIVNNDSCDCARRTQFAHSLRLSYSEVEAPAEIFSGGGGTRDVTVIYWIK